MKSVLHEQSGRYSTSTVSSECVMQGCLAALKRQEKKTGEKKGNQT